MVVITNFCKQKQKEMQDGQKEFKSSVVVKHERVEIYRDGWGKYAKHDDIFRDF
jgi:hypothetical protein